MILVLTNEQDLTSDYIILELQKRGIDYFRLNSERISSAKIRGYPCRNSIDWEIEIDNRLIRLNEVKAAYFRRPGRPIIPENISDVRDQIYCVGEWESVLRSIYGILGDRWLNSPSNITLAEDKPRQLSLAQKAGFSIPETLITNDYGAVITSFSKAPFLGKTLYSGLLEGFDAQADKVIFSTRLSPNDITIESAYAAPVIFQLEILKALDIRVTVVGNDIFTTAIDSQIREETTTDWRRGSHPDLPHTVHYLPFEIAQKCIIITKHLHLRFAAIDLVLDRNGTYWFLEANPNGQWAWIESRTGLQISSAIVSELLKIDSQIVNK